MISFNAISIIFLFPILIHGQLWSNDQNQFSPESFATYSQLQGEVPFNRELSIFLFKSEIKRFVCIRQFDLSSIYDVAMLQNLDLTSFVYYCFYFIT